MLLPKLLYGPSLRCHGLSYTLITLIMQDRLHATGRESLLDEVEFELVVAAPLKQSQHLYIQVS